MSLAQYCSLWTMWTTSVRGDGPPLKIAGHKFFASGARGPVSVGGFAPAAAKYVAHQSEMCMMPSHFIPRLAVGSSGDHKKASVLTPPYSRQQSRRM